MGVRINAARHHIAAAGIDQHKSAVAKKLIDQGWPRPVAVLPENRGHRHTLSAWCGPQDRAPSADL
jgi:hypothetical protein